MGQDTTLQLFKLDTVLTVSPHVKQQSHVSWCLGLSQSHSHGVCQMVQSLLEGIILLLVYQESIAVLPQMILVMTQLLQK